MHSPFMHCAVTSASVLVDMRRDGRKVPPKESAALLRQSWMLYQGMQVYITLAASQHRAEKYAHTLARALIKTLRVPDRRAPAQVRTASLSCSV